MHIYRSASLDCDSFRKKHVDGVILMDVIVSLFVSLHIRDGMHA